ncbi:MAG: 16S rRNA (guanine(966)-N(2))-methyltransferase RsmD [Clostridia bacterium]|nr:16S rRNA (guanine(966)-N(2))-methyltransferase RsmD [Clostridia bacterium]
MRIISGRARGTNLFAPEGLDTRPTLDRVREAIFSMIFTRTDGARVLDLFAGSGAMGLEALSRGAVAADFVDISPKACECVRKNLEKTRLESAKVSNTDFKTFLSNCNGCYDIIFLDPPYEAGYYSTALDIIKERSLLGDDGIIVLECSEPDGFDCRGFEVYRQRKYGKAAVYLLQTKEKTL